MRKLFEALGVIITPLLKLGEEIDRYTERKKITDRLFVALSTEINDFNKNSDDLSREAEIVLIPIIENVKDSPGIPEIKKVACFCDFTLVKYDLLWNNFIQLVNGCNNISQNEAFMKDLKKSNSMLYDFVSDMAKLRKQPGRIKIDSGFLTFFKLYQDELFKDFSEEESKEAENKLKKYVYIAKSKIAPMLKKQTIGRAIWKSIGRNFLKLNKTIKKIDIDVDVSKSLRKYVPTKFMNIVILIDVSQILKPLVEQKRELDYPKKQE